MKPMVYFAWTLSQKNGNHTKIGKTKYIRNRKSSLDTSYSEYGINFEFLIPCETEEIESEMEEYLHAYFWKDSTTHLEYHNGGIEWFQKRYLLNDIQTALNKGGFNNEIINDKDKIKEILKDYNKIYQNGKRKYIENMNKIHKKINIINEKIPPTKYKTKLNIIDFSGNMRDYQLNNKIINWFDINDKGILNWCCGLGKTIESLYISTKYIYNGYLLIGINNLALIEQWIKSIKLFYENYPILCISSEIIKKEFSTTNINKIKEWFSKNNTGIVITTYRSAHQLLKTNLIFNFSILDEVHHLCNLEKDKEGHKNIDILDLNVKKRLSLTATMKQIDDEENNNKIDNMNISVFGEIIDNKSVLWGIENKYICDYQLNVPRITYQELEDIIGKSLDKNSCYLYLSAYIALLTLKKETSKKLLIFVNKIDDMEKIYKIIINMLLSDNEYFNIKNNNIFKTNNENIKTSEIIHKFNQINTGILINCFKIGEGIDIPTLDSVLFADNMESTIRITQAALRGCRKDLNNENKIANIIVPTIYEKEEDKSYNENENIKGFDTLMHIIKELSISDENIIQKIIPSIIKSENSSRKPRISFYQDIQEEYKFKMRIIKRNELGKKTFPSCKRIIQKMGGRKENKLTFYRDYINNKQNMNGLPDSEWMKNYLDKNNKTWIDLYSFDTSHFLKWSEFEQKYKKKLTKEEYDKLNDIKLPKSHDLEDIYGRSNYNRGFWDDSIYDD